jgi:hypothetical protein
VFHLAEIHRQVVGVYGMGAVREGNVRKYSQNIVSCSKKIGLVWMTRNKVGVKTVQM